MWWKSKECGGEDKDEKKLKFLVEHFSVAVGITPILTSVFVRMDQLESGFVSVSGNLSG